LLFLLRFFYQLLRGVGWKQSRQYTGLSPEGWKGTVVSFPHSAQTAGNIWRSERLLLYPPEGRFCAFLAARHSGHRPGSLVNPFSAKKSCSDAENTNSRPQSLQVKTLSVNIKNTSSFDMDYPAMLRKHSTSRDCGDFIEYNHCFAFLSV